jgi:pimeloyl-ACP methyl ester carboxylesterase
MENYRIYGKGQIETAVLHGGPGAAGSVAAVAKRLSGHRAVIEPLQTKDSIAGQVNELKNVIQSHCSTPVNLIGHSWGAWLACIFAANHPLLVKKTILVASASFDDKYADQINKTRAARLTDRQKKELESLIGLLEQKGVKNKSIYLAAISSIFLKTDSYALALGPKEKVLIRYAIFKNVWAEAEKMRRSKELIATLKKISCSVIVIHGDYDPHPFAGVKEPLDAVLKDVHYILLSKCGHYPWLEKNTEDLFFEILEKELKG